MRFFCNNLSHLKKITTIRFLIYSIVFSNLIFFNFVRAQISAEQAIASSISNTNRPASDILKDANREPAAIMSFFKIKPDSVILDVLAGSGYYSELLSNVVGEQGKVIIHNDKHFLKYYGDKLASRLAGGTRLTNSERIDISLNKLSLQENSLDTIMLILGYHDFFYVMNEDERIDVELVLAKFKKYLKPNGIIGIVDHEAHKGFPSTVGGTLHRIDPQIVKEQMNKAGFILDGELNILKNNSDDKLKKIWDISDGKTSRFVFRFINVK